MNTLLYSSLMTLPIAFCWTRMGIEAGQSLAGILERKEEERQANDGLFFWGIGNAVGPSVSELLRHCSEPEVIFSPIKAAARDVDVKPENVVAWTAAESLDGAAYALPPRVLITSRFDPSNPKSQHYALVCSSNKCLTTGTENGEIEFGDLVNLLTGRPVGTSQVTAIVRRVAGARTPIRSYSVMLRTRLAAPFFLRLRNPVLLPKVGTTESWDRAVRQRWANTRQSIQAN